MLGMNKAVFLETPIKEEFNSDVYVDDKVLVSKTTVDIDFMELDECSKGDQTKLNLISTDIKLELSPSNVMNDYSIMDTVIKCEFPSSDLNYYNTIIDDNIKIENNIVSDIKIKFNNRKLFCNNCNEYYEEYCSKCGMLVCILNGNGLNNKGRKEIPANVLEIKESLFGDIGIFALKTIPKGVKFGPYTGFSTAESSWRLKGGKFVVSNDKLESLNWMQYVNCAKSVSDQNLCAFQYEDNLFYSSVCEIQEGEELLVYFGEEYEESLNNNTEMDFIPHIETDAKNVFACTYCCLGFSLKVYLVEHKTGCPNRTNGIFEEVVQCPFCKIYLEKEEYLEFHKIFCSKENARHCVHPPLDNLILERKSISPVTDKRKKLKLTRCMECQYKTSNKLHLKLHMKTKHLKEFDYNCTKCEYKTNNKTNLKAHVKAKHLKEYDFNCAECGYKTNYKSVLEAHIKTKHLREYDYSCVECEYKTNTKNNLQIHTKTKHLKQYDYHCMECEYKTNVKLHLKEHIRTKHLEKYYNCMELHNSVCVAVGNNVMTSASLAVCKHAYAVLRLSVLPWQPLRMELPLDITAKCELRAVIRFLNAKGTAPIEIHRQLTEVYGKSCMDVKNVRTWCREFAAGRTEIHDEQRSGRPSISDETVLKVEQSMREDRRITLDDLCTLVPEVSRSTVHRILTETLNYRKVCARWVPRMLTEDTYGNEFMLPAHFFTALQPNRTTFWTQLSRVTKPGHTTLHLRQSNNQGSGGILLRQSRGNSNKHSLPVKS